MKLFICNKIFRIETTEILIYCKKCKILKYSLKKKYRRMVSQNIKYPFKPCFNDYTKQKSNIWWLHTMKSSKQILFHFYSLLLLLPHNNNNNVHFNHKQCKHKCLSTTFPLQLRLNTHKIELCSYNQPHKCKRCYRRL